MLPPLNAWCIYYLHAESCIFRMVKLKKNHLGLYLIHSKHDILDHKYDGKPRLVSCLLLLCFLVVVPH